MFNKFKTKKTKIKADEFDFGDDFMFDFDSDVPPPPKTGREAVTELGQDFLRGGANYLKSESFIRKQLDDHFPKGFGQTLDITGKASDSIRTLYDTAEKELKPAVNDLRKITSKILPKADKLLPKGLKAKLDQFASGYEDEYANSGRGDQREGLLQSSLNDMFRFQIEQAAGAEANGMARQQLSEVMSSVRHGESVFQLDAIRRSVSIMEQYHTKITVGYQRRSLELQTRQYYVAQEQLEETKRMLTLQSRELAAIRNNTGLPEYVKLNNSERLAEHLRNRFMGSATNAMFGAGADFLPKLMDRMVKKGVDKITEIASSGTMLTGMVTSGLDQAEAFGMSNPVNSVAEGAGAEGIGYLANKLFAKHIAPRVKNAEGIQKLGNNLAYGINNAGSLANEWASGDHPNLINRQVQSLANRLPQATPLGEEADGVKGWFQKRYQDVREGLTSADIENGPLGGFFDFLRENVKEELDVNNKLFANTPDNLNKPTSLSHAGLRSLTEIIPGLLSRQLRELQIIRTGDTSIGLTQYDLLNGKFANEQEMDVSLSKVLFNEDLSEKNKGLKDKDKLKSVNDSLQGLLKLVGADSLSPEQQRDLRNALIDRSIDKKSVSKAFLTDPASFKSQHGAVFSQLFSKHLEDDKMGIKHGEFADAFNTLGAGTNINFESVQNLVNAGYGQQLEDMGIIRDGRIDYRQYAKILINGQGERKQKVKATEPLNTNPLMQAVNQQPAQPAEPVQIKQEFNKTRNVNQNLNVDMSSVTERLDKYSVKTEMQTVVDLMTKIHQSFVEGLLIKGFGNGDENRKDPKWYQKSLLAGIGDLIGGTLGLGKKAAGGLWESGKYTGRMMAKAGSWGIGKGLAIGKGAIGMAGSAVNKAFGDFHDIYLPGSNEPIMEAWKLKAGHYASSINNKLIIKKPKDFQKVVALGGTIIDLTKRLPTGFETVCKASDLENAVIVKRNGGAVKLSAIAGKLFKTAYQTGNAMLRGMGGLGRMASSALAFAGKHLGLMLDGPMDVYVPGEQSPRLLAVVMRNGGYTSGTTGNVISKVSQIDGDVKYNGETVLTVDELRKGVVDKNGKAIKLGQGALGKLASLTGGLLKGGYKAIMKGAKMVGNFLMGGMGLAKDFLKGVFGEGIIVTSKRTISVLEEIKAILEERLPKSKSAFGDTDGDGIREGSVADLRKKRAALAAKAREAANAPGGTAAKAGVGGTLKAAWDKMRAKEEQEARDEEAEDSWLEMAGDAADIADFANGDGGGEGDERKGKGKKPGRMRRAGRYAKGKAGQAGRLLGRGAKGIGKGLWGATKAVGRGIGSTARNIPGGKATGALAIGLGGLAAYDISQDKSLAISQKNTEYSDISGGVAGGLAGAAAGAAIGSVVPVVGTVIGGLAGGLIGGFAGSGIGRAIGSALFNKSLDEFGQLRYLQYGFKVEDQRYTQAIYDLEKMMTRAVIRTGGQITLDPGKINAQAMAELFGADISDEKSINRWSQWMLMRFKPVYLAHANAAEKAKAGTSVLDVGSLSDDLKADFLAALKVPENIYNVTSSPVKEVPELLATQSMATQFLDTLKVKYKKDPNKAKAAKTATPPAGAAVSGAAAVAAAAVPQKAQANKAVGQPAQAKTLGSAGAILVGSASMADSVGNVSPLETVMLKAMGLVDMDPGKISTLHSLTKDVLEEIAVNKNKAEYKGLVDPMYRKFSGAFGCDSEDQAQYEFFKKWFTFRYMPVLVNAISCILKNGGKKEDVLSLSTVAGKVAYETANAVKSSLCGGEMGSVPVWNSPYSPWPNYVLNATLSSVEGNIAALKNSLSANTIKEVTAKENPAKSKTAIEALTERFKAMKDKAAGLLQDGMQAAKDAGNYVKDGAVNLGNKAGELVSEAGSAMKEGAYNLAGNLGFDGGTIGGHVGKGTGGDINSIPEPKGPEGKWASIKDMILAVSKMTGVDPNLMAAVAAKESSFKWNVKAETSSATGLYQFIRSTWDTMLKRYGSKYGIAPGTSPKDPRANALMGAEFIRENSKAIQSVKPGGLSPTDLYIAHFLGAAGAKKFFQAGQNAIGAVIFPEAAKANKSVFYDNGRPRSLGEIYQIFRSNIEGTMKKMGLGNGVGAAEAPPPGVPTSVNNAPLPPANPGKETSPAVAGGAAPVPQKAQAKPAAGIVPIAPVPSNQPSIPAQQVQAPSAGVVSSPAVQQRTVQDNKIQQDAYTALVASNKAISDTLNASLAEHKTHTGLLREIAASLGKAANQAGELSKGANKSMKDQFKKTTEMTAPPVSMAKGVM